MGRLTTHVLDTANGRPAAGLAFELVHWADRRERRVLLAARTNADGRFDGPLLEGERFVAGDYELRFEVGRYFASAVGGPHPDAGRFLGVVPVVFRVDDPAAHYHVPLLVSPWAYSTYRGS